MPQNRLKDNLINLLNNIKRYIVQKQKQSFLFIAVNIFVAFLGFVRSFAFMKFLDLSGLGLITLIQTGIMLIGFFQFGLINGGYRIVAIQNKEYTGETNNVIFSYLGLLSFILLLVSSLLLFFNIITDAILIYITLLAGILFLIYNWVSNNLIARQNLMAINRANIIAASTSILSLPLAYYFGVVGGAFVILIQPLIFITIAIIRDHSILPTRWIFRIAEIKHILHFGFIPYLSGLFFLLYIQAERWSINTFLGTAELGKLYLVFLISNLWVLVPRSLLNLFFPLAVKCYENKNIREFWEIVRKHSISLIGFNIGAIVLIFLFLNTFVNFMFYNHHNYVVYVFISLPGFFLRTLSDPISLVLNSVVKLKPIFFSDITSFAFYLSFIFTLLLLNKFSLFTIILSMNIYFLIKFISLLISFMSVRKVLLYK